MNLIFFIRSSTVTINSYTIKDIPGSSGRLDVISRCILAAILGIDNFEENVKIWIFLDNYGTFIFESESFNYNDFPKNEILFTNYFVKFLQKEDLESNPLIGIKTSEMGIIEAIRSFQKLDYNIYVLKEEGKDFFKLRGKIQEKGNIVFILGSQEGKFIDSEELLALKLPKMSIGTKSYLASSVIRLLKLLLFSL